MLPPIPRFKRLAVRCDSGALVIAEDEEPVLDDRAARRCAKLILFVRAASRAVLVVLPRIRVQLFVLEELEQRSVDFIGTGLELDVDHAAGAASVLGVVAVGQNGHFADGFHRRTDDVGGLVQEVDDIDVVVDAVEQEVILPVRADAVGRERSARFITGARFARNYAGGQTREETEHTRSAER